MFVYREEYYDQRVRAPRRGRRDHRQAPQRPDRQGRADLPVRSIRASRASTATAPRDAGAAVRTGPADVLRPVPDAREPEPTCRFGECDGSGWLLDEETNTARRCRCRDAAGPRRLRRACAAASRSACSPPRSTATPTSSRACVRHVRRFVAEVEPNLDAGRGLWFHGTVGTGKTSLAMLVAKAARDAGRSVAIYSVPLLFAEMRDTFGERQRRLPPRALPPALRGRPAGARRPRRRAADRVGARAALLARQRALAGPALDRRHEQRARPLPRRDPGHAPRRDRASCAAGARTGPAGTTSRP